MHGSRAATNRHSKREDTMKELLDAKAAGTYVRLAPQTLAKMRVYGNGPVHYKVGSRILYDRADLDAWLDARRRNSTSTQVGASKPEVTSGKRV